MQYRPIGLISVWVKQQFQFVIFGMLFCTPEDPGEIQPYASRWNFSSAPGVRLYDPETMDPPRCLFGNTSMSQLWSSAD